MYTYDDVRALLPQDVAEQLDLARQADLTFKDTPAKFPYHYLNYNLSWANTPQGREYWRDVYDILRKLYRESSV